MRLAIISCVESMISSHVDLIDKICRNMWDIPETVRFFNIFSETNYNTKVAEWANLYFGCKFITDSPKPVLLSIVNNLNTSSGSTATSSIMSPRLSRSSSASPRSGISSPRIISSPRKFSKSCVEYLQDIADNCTHVIIIGMHEHSNIIVKMFPVARVIILAN